MYGTWGGKHLGGTCALGPGAMFMRIFNPLERWENQDWWRQSDVYKTWREALVEPV